MSFFRILFAVNMSLLASCASLTGEAPLEPVKDAIKRQNLVETKPYWDALRSGGIGPKVTLIPAGQFMMGSSDDEIGRYINEGPQHLVKIARPFLLGTTEVSVAQFRHFVEMTGYKTDGERNSGSFLRDARAERGKWRLKQEVNWRFDHEGKLSRDDNPVVHVSWNDAQAYLGWLSEETAEHYRLPSEAELEYANRAGSPEPYWWGEGTPSQKIANIRGDGDETVADPLTWKHTGQERGFLLQAGEGLPVTFKNYSDGFHGLAPVANFSSNPFGLFDTAGNVWEWVQDCWHFNYKNAPVDGSAWVEEKCDQRVVRGGSFYCFPTHVRSANRWSRWPELRNMYIGFRVARDL